MNRSPMPAGRVPLQRRTLLPPATSPLHRAVPLQRRVPLAVVSTRRRRENRERTPVVGALRLTSQGRCARCSQTGLPVFGHERLARAHGGSVLQPDCVLCCPCNSAIEDAPREACWNGWKISPKWPHDPALRLWEARDLHGNVVDFRVLAGAA